MKKTQLLCIAVIITAALISQQASAKIWRVNNKSNYDGINFWGDNLGGTQNYPVFAQINSTLVAAGDTFYVEPSTIPYADANIDRKVTIIGSGYFLSRNPHVSSTTDSSSIGNVTFSSGSDGSQIIGMSNVNTGSTSKDFVILTNNITVKRCNLKNSIVISNNSNGTGLSDVYILENFFNSNALGVYGNSGIAYPIDFVFNNNICKGALIWGGTILQCDNNVFDGPQSSEALQFTTSEFKNNILKTLNATININNGSNLNVSYNIGTSASQFGTANNNIVVASIASIFVTPTSPDGAYQIASGSAANNSGSDGTDRGAFGGAAVTDRYTLSGLAAIPVIYSVSTKGATATNLPVTIQARTIK